MAATASNLPNLDQDLRTACGVLGIGVGPTLTKVTARSAMRRIVAECHPDGNGGGDEALFNSVMTAYRRVEAILADGSPIMAGPDMFIGQTRLRVVPRAVVDEDIDAFLDDGPGSAATSPFSSGSPGSFFAPPTGFAEPFTPSAASAPTAGRARPATLRQTTEGQVRGNSTAKITAREAMLFVSVVAVGTALRAVFQDHHPFGVWTVHVPILIIAVVMVAITGGIRATRWQFWYVTPLCLSVGEALPLVLLVPVWAYFMFFSPRRRVTGAGQSRRRKAESSK